MGLNRYAMPASVLAACCLVGASLFGRFSHRDAQESIQVFSSGGVRRRLDEKQEHHVVTRPVIYTFYHEFNGAEGGGTGMSSEDDRVLLDIWRTEWHNAGWNPRVLTIEDAKQHPHFLTLNAMLDGLPFKMYDRLCFIRWLAMANQPNGGFMVDYDVFPLAWIRHGVPNGGRLTVHEGSPSGGVPSMISASQSEWFRFAWSLAENAIQHKDESHWSDMKAMQNIYMASERQAYLQTRGLLPAQAVLHGQGFPSDTCERAANSMAIHFSHHSMDKGVTPEGKSGPEHRGPLAKEWLESWRTSCRTLAAGEAEDIGDITAGLGGFHLPAYHVDSEERGYRPPQEDNSGEGRTVQIAEEEPKEYTSPGDSDGPEIRFKDPMEPIGDRPIIFTFYEEVGEEHTGMTAEHNIELINAWAKTWYEVGWDPRVLTVAVAKQHQEFDIFNGMLEGLPFRKFDRVCFYRWLAMGMVGGGWLSDYDTFPLNKVRWSGNGDPRFLPNDGDLTVHELSKSGGVPSLVSGNANEWFRLAKAQVENAKSHDTQPHWSDMKAMQDIFQKSEGTFYKMEENVVMGDAMLRSDTINRDLCLWLRDKFAVHFSHYSMQRSGRYETGKEGARHRAAVGRSWILEYRNVCAAYEEEQ